MEHLPVPGIPATLRFSLLGWQPQHVIRDGTGQTWDVQEVLDGWKNPGRLDLSRTQVVAWYVLLVTDPWPVLPGHEHEAVMQVTSYSDRPGWWIESLPGRADNQAKQG